MAKEVDLTDLQLLVLECAFELDQELEAGRSAAGAAGRFDPTPAKEWRKIRTGGRQAFYGPSKLRTLVEREAKRRLNLAPRQSWSPGIGSILAALAARKLIETGGTSEGLEVPWLQLTRRGRAHVRQVIAEREKEADRQDAELGRGEWTSYRELLGDERLRELFAEAPFASSVELEVSIAAREGIQALKRGE